MFKLIVFPTFQLYDLFSGKPTINNRVSPLSTHLLYKSQYLIQ